MDDTIHQLTTKFLKTLSQNLGKSTSKNNSGGINEILSDPTLQIIIHMISCTKMLRDAFEASTGAGSAAVSASGGINSAKKPKSSIHFQLYQPMLNGILVLLGKMLMDSFTYEPKVTETASFSTAYGILGRHVLNQFPEMATKKHKTSGKMLIHHAVFKARPAIAEETVGLILKVAPSSGRAEDATGALPLHWATRNPDVSFEVIDLLLKAHPEAPGKTDSKGFLPLHWAVNQDAPNVEVVRKLIKIFPAGAGMPSLSGNLPLHYCVSRARPSIPVIKALITAYPEAVRSGCEEGYLPLHRYLYRPIVDLDALRLLINYFPDALRATSGRNQTPLHVALDHHEPDALAVALLMEVCPAAVAVADTDRYLPLHLCLDCAEPNYALALQLLMAHPQAASFASKDGMLPLHLLVGANSDPTHEHSASSSNSTEGATNEATTFVNALLNAHPQALVMSVRDIIPAMDGEALADPESWSGEWVETYWTPLTRARDRGLTGLVALFKQFQQRHGIVDPTESVASSRGTAGTATGLAPPTISSSSGGGGAGPTTKPTTLQGADVRFNENNVSTENINFNAAKPMKSQPLYALAPAVVPVAVTSNPNNYSGLNPLRNNVIITSRGGGGGSRSGVGSVSEDDFEEGYAAQGASEDEGANIVNRVSRLSKPSGTGAPTARIPPHILKAQQNARSSNGGGSQSGESRGSSRERGGAEDRQQQALLQQQYARQQQQQQDGHLYMESVGEMASYRSNSSRDVTPLRQGLRPQSGFHPSASMGSARSQGSGAGNRGPPPGPIPASLLQAAENNAVRHQQQNQQQGRTSSQPPGISAVQQQLINDAARASRRSQQQQQQQSGNVPSSPAYPGKNKGGRSPRSPKGGSSRSPKNSFVSADTSGKVGLSATTGRALPNSRSNAGGNGNNNNSADSQDAEDRVGTAPVLGGKTRLDGQVVGFGSRSAWSNGEETAEDSTIGQADQNSRATPAPATALTAKQQRLLQAQQAYMKRAAGVTGSNSNAPSSDALASGVNTLKPGPGPSPSSGIHLKAAPTNHTSEILRSLGGAAAGGKVRIHPLAGNSSSSSGGGNVRVVPASGNSSNNLDEMV